MALNVPSGIVTVASGAGAPQIARVNALPVAIFGGSGDVAISHYSGALNVNISGWGTINANVSGNVVQISGQSVIVGTSGYSNVIISTSGGDPLIPATSDLPGTAGLLAAGIYVLSSGTGSQLVRVRGVDRANDGYSGIGTLAVGPYVLNSGGTWDRVRGADGATGTSGIGVLGVAVLGWDTAAYQRIATAQYGDDTGVQQGLAVVNFPMLLNATTWDRQRSIVGASGTAGTGVQAVGMMSINPAGNMEPLKSTSGALNVSSSGVGSVNISLSGGTQIRDITGSSGITAGVLATHTVGYNYTNISGASVINVKSGTAYIHTVVGNWSSGNFMEIRDSASGLAGTIIVLGAHAGTPSHDSQLLDVLVTSGIVTSVSGNTFNGVVTWRAA